MGAARLTRYSFNRMLIRRAFADGWRIERSHTQLDPAGRGEVRFAVTTGTGPAPPASQDPIFTFIAYTSTLEESEHTDRVIAERWEITAALIEGSPDPDQLERLRREVPLQERGRLDPNVLVLTRGNRSVRFFQYLVDTLANGEQPDPDLVGDAGYIMRSTAFYGNGKFGMRSFEGYHPGHPLGVPYRAQFLCAWLFRELSYVVVEHCAKLKGGDDAVVFGTGWDRFFGLGNATGLGLVPYAFGHPGVIDAWASIREQALAAVRSLTGDPKTSAELSAWIERAAVHYQTGSGDDCSPFLSSAELAPIVSAIEARFAACRAEPLPYDALYRWAEAEGPETAELVVSLLIELHRGDDDLVDERYRVAEEAAVDPATTVAAIADRITTRYPWLDELDLEDDAADHYWWLVSDNTYEPRRAPRSALAPDGRDVMVDIALRLHRLRSALNERAGDEPIHRFLAERPEHRAAVERLGSHFRYGEPLDNACHRSYLPLMVQRFQLATYGMDNFKPKSTDWLRVTLYQGAPRVGELVASDPDSTDRWVWPPRPNPPVQPVETEIP